MKSLTFLTLTGVLAIASPALAQAQPQPQEPPPPQRPLRSARTSARCRPGMTMAAAANPFGALVQPKRTNVGSALDMMRPRSGLASMASPTSRFAASSATGS
jgi:hypothetical protein